MLRCPQLFMLLNCTYACDGIESTFDVHVHLHFTGHQGHMHDTPVKCNMLTQSHFATVTAGTLCMIHPLTSAHIIWLEVNLSACGYSLWSVLSAEKQQSSYTYWRSEWNVKQRGSQTALGVPAKDHKYVWREDKQSRASETGEYCGTLCVTWCVTWCVTLCVTLCAR